MDSHSFRTMAGELFRLLDGARVEKIHGPHPGLFLFTIFAGGVKRRLCFRHERQYPALFFTERHMDNPPRPSALVMRLRKYCQGRRLGPGALDFASRRLAFPVAAGAGATVFLVLDLVHGACVSPSLPEGFGAPAPWPDGAVVDALCSIPWKKNAHESLWQDYVLLTPFLRETLACLEPLEGRALMVDLEAGGDSLFLYADNSGKPALYAAWPLPPALCARRRLRPEPLFPEDAPAEDVVFRPWQAPSALADFPSLACITVVDEPKIFAEIGRSRTREEALPERRAAKKRDRLLAKLDGEEQRLRAMLAMREDARALQADLWRYPAPERRASVTLVDGEGRERRLALDPLLTVRENMARMFRQSARGSRGLAMLDVRRKALLADAGPGLPAFSERDGAGPAEAPGEEPFARDTAAPAQKAPSWATEQPFEAGRKSPDVARFFSSDGFVMLRGKNARGNRSLLKIGSGHDLWLHAEEGPSAHLIIRRSHAAEEVPQRTLMEAAVLVGEKSWQRHDDRARVMVAMLRHVHAIKGAAPGTVRVDTVLQSLVVPLRSGPEPGIGTISG